MRVIPVEKLDAAGLAPHERFFVELWYSMTHDLSLDSYRVKCMNVRSLVRELSDEIRIGRIADSELQPLCRETAEALADDPVVKTAFPVNLAIIKPFLDAPPVAKDKQDRAARNASEAWRRFGFAAEDFALALQRDYFRRLCDALPGAVKPQNEVEIKAIVSALLSDLVDQGWPLESLFRWHTKFLNDGEPAPQPFDSNLRFVLKHLARGKQSFRVTLRISGSPRIRAVGAFHDFKLSTETTLVSNAGDEAQAALAKRFGETNAQVVFATTTTDAVDAISSAIAARAGFEQLIDLLRFDYESSAVKIEDLCYTWRQEDGRADFPRIRHAVPNPRERTVDGDFLRLVRDVDLVAGKSHVDLSSRQQLVAALRLYRFGRDSEGYRDKFLNWWMALESLCNVSQGRSIGETVTRNCSRVMLTRYLFRLVRDLLTTLKFLRISWPVELAGVTHCPTLDRLTVSQLVTILQSATHADQLWSLCAANPLVVLRGRQIGQVLAESKPAHQRLSQHLQHLEWHLNRIYRIRCCIVHGSPIRFELALITANLEFYLKEMLRFVIEALRDHDHIESLEELFGRASIVTDRCLSELNAGSAALDAIREIVFLDIVPQERP